MPGSIWNHFLTTFFSDVRETKATCTDCAVFFHLLSIKHASPGFVFLYSTVLSLVAIDCWNWKALWHPSEWQKQQIPTKDVCLPGCKLPTGLPRAEQTETACFVQLEEPKWKLSIYQSFSKDSIHLEPHRQFQCFTAKSSSIDLSRISRRCLVGTSGDSHHWHHYQNNKWARVRRMEVSAFLMWLHVFSDFSFSLLRLRFTFIGTLCSWRLNPTKNCAQKNTQQYRDRS